ncbi:MAG: YHS domain-containing (seleno)protein [Pseudomonadota bacterium]
MTLAAGQAAADVINQTTFGGVAIDGYDTVAYFTQGKAVEGDSDFESEWMDATWRFASADHKALFDADPEKYAPQYGGYCAFAVANDTTASIEGDLWDIVDGKLYLNYSKGVQKKWRADVPGMIANANQNWPAIEEDLK